MEENTFAFFMDEQRGGNFQFRHIPHIDNRFGGNEFLKKPPVSVGNFVDIQATFQFPAEKKLSYLEFVQVGKGIRQCVQYPVKIEKVLKSGAVGTA